MAETVRLYTPPKTEKTSVVAPPMSTPMAAILSALARLWIISPTAPGVGTLVPGGATYREAHLIMELLHDSDLVRSVDIVELNPFLDERGRTARVMVELIGSLFGQQITDRPMPSNAILPPGE